MSSNSTSSSLVSETKLMVTLNSTTNVPSVNRDASVPSVNRDINVPPVNRDTSTPSVNHDTSTPPVNRDTSTPSVDRETSVPPVNRDTSLTAEKENFQNSNSTDSKMDLEKNLDIENGLSTSLAEDKENMTEPSFNYDRPASNDTRDFNDSEIKTKVRGMDNLSSWESIYTNNDPNGFNDSEITAEVVRLLVKKNLALWKKIINDTTVFTDSEIKTIVDGKDNLEDNLKTISSSNDTKSFSDSAILTEVVGKDNGTTENVTVKEELRSNDTPKGSKSDNDITSSDPRNNTTINEEPKHDNDTMKTPKEDIILANKTETTQQEQYHEFVASKNFSIISLVTLKDLVEEESDRYTSHDPQTEVTTIVMKKSGLVSILPKTSSNARQAINVSLVSIVELNGDGELIDKLDHHFQMAEEIFLFDGQTRFYLPMSSIDAENFQHHAILGNKAMVLLYIYIAKDYGEIEYPGHSTTGKIKIRPGMVFVQTCIHNWNFCTDDCGKGPGRYLGIEISLASPVQPVMQRSQTPWVLAIAPASTVTIPSLVLLDDVIDYGFPEFTLEDVATSKLNFSLPVFEDKGCFGLYFDHPEGGKLTSASVSLVNNDLNVVSLFLFQQLVTIFLIYS